MKKIIIVVVGILFTNLIFAQAVKYKLKTLNTGFVIKNAGINVKGSFKKGSATLSIDEKSIEKSKFSGLVEASSISTGITLRDTHIKEKTEFFDVAKYPSIKLESTKIAPSSTAGTYLVTWAITMKGVTKSITAPLTCSIVNGVLTMNTNFTINRRDWNVGEKSMMMNDNVKVSISGTATK